MYTHNMAKRIVIAVKWLCDFSVFIRVTGGTDSNRIHVAPYDAHIVNYNLHDLSGSAILPVILKETVLVV
jgi:hypothetical protein